MITLPAPLRTFASDNAAGVHPAVMAALVEANAGHALADFLVAAEKEKAGLVNPYVTDPDPLFKWVADDVLKVVKVAAASNHVAAKRALEGA